MPRLPHLLPASLLLLLAAPALAAQQVAPPAPPAPEPRPRPSVEEREALERKLLVEESVAQRRDLARVQRALEEQRVLLRAHPEILERRLARVAESRRHAERVIERLQDQRSEVLERRTEAAQRMLERYHLDRMRADGRRPKTVEL